MYKYLSVVFNIYICYIKIEFVYLGTEDGLDWDICPLAFVLLKKWFYTWFIWYTNLTKLVDPVVYQPEQLTGSHNLSKTSLTWKPDTLGQFTQLLSVLHVFLSVLH